ncbi:tetratricopeptide repeat-containing glycosyltransferase family protein [Uliginosibacterium sp. H3]|uniref:Tetratricopeptide repeat-containing glycosyltransferase family protein n=1 Tax=Uliginosibacterium silvisoli TaxID=3114758 RepID=A0ABU6K706_9RHOO|nr:tetratricopeptide repeat-containing glycosyltransferase family protein [Uliginosibacterium sp. H3]
MFGFSRKPPCRIPDSLIAALDALSYPDLSVELQRWCTQVNAIVDEEKLLEAAKRRGWNEKACEKIKIIISYYLNDYSRAFELSRRFIEPDEGFDADIFTLCIGILYRNNQFEDAASLMAAVSEERDELSARDDYWVLRAVVSWSVCNVTAAHAAIDRALEILPKNRIVLENAVSIYWELGAQGKFKAAFDRLSELGFDTGYAYALVLLAMGRYSEGFERMEARYQMDETNRYLNKALTSTKHWNGVESVGKGLLLSAEQGLGDSVQMARYIPDLFSVTGGRLAVEVQVEALSFLQYNFPEIQFFPREYGKLPDVKFDHWIGMMSLPLIFKTEIDTIPRRFSYLKAPSDCLEYWRARVEGLAPDARRRRIGIAWSGQSIHRADRRRSISFSLIANWIRECDADFFALQKIVPDIRPVNLIDVSAEMMTLGDTAALIQEMDLVVTVDTSIVHIAGALGKPTLLLLPFRYEWRWGMEGEENPWYESVRVFRQQRAGEWANVLAVVFNNEILRTIGERSRSGITV